MLHFVRYVAETRFIVLLLIMITIVVVIIIIKFYFIPPQLVRYILICYHTVCHADLETSGNDMQLQVETSQVHCAEGELPVIFVSHTFIC